MKSFFEDGVYDEILSRLIKLNKDSSAIWGKINIGQMLYHCQMPLNIILEKEDYGVKPNWLINLLFKKAMYSDKLWKKNLSTAKGFATNNEKNFDTEKQAVTTLINALNTQRNRID